MSLCPEEPLGHLRHIRELPTQQVLDDIGVCLEQPPQHITLHFWRHLRRHGHITHGALLGRRLSRGSQGPWKDLRIWSQTQHVGVTPHTPTRACRISAPAFPPLSPFLWLPADSKNCYKAFWGPEMLHSNRPEGTLTAAWKCPEGRWREDGARAFPEDGHRPRCASLTAAKSFPLLLLEEFRGKEDPEELP